VSKKDTEIAPMKIRTAMKKSGPWSVSALWRGSASRKGASCGQVASPRVNRTVQTRVRARRVIVSQPKLFGECNLPPPPLVCKPICLQLTCARFLWNFQDFSKQYFPVCLFQTHNDERGWEAEIRSHPAPYFLLRPPLTHHHGVCDASGRNGEVSKQFFHKHF